MEELHFFKVQERNQLHYTVQ